MTLHSEGKRVFADGVHALRAFAAIAVVFYHCGATMALDKYQGMKNIESYTQGLDAGVDLFFVISGFVMALPLFKKRNVDIPRYFENRILRIYPLSILTACIFLGMGWAAMGRTPEVDDILSSILLLPNGTTSTPVVLWTLKQELLFYTLFALTFANRRAGLALLTLWGATSLFVTGSSPLMQWLFNAHNVQFLMGILAGYLFIERMPERGPARMIGGLGSFAFLGLALTYKTLELTPEVSSLVFGILGTAAVLGAASSKLRVPTALMFLGSASYSIYLIHFLLVSFGNKVAFKLGPAMPGVVTLVLVSSFAVVGGCFYYSVFEKRLESWRHTYLKWRDASN
ncbi:acyltransferase family protein [Novosphingobium sp. MBES04]|uniref:acyltransferase family protein n=1 Tax=Novosphingobium sp. MBES04 TaxID=1206458 RepID=UPI000580A51B|nr:acyltransferase [Novosphingobium sp. MBES04]